MGRFWYLIYVIIIFAGSCCGTAAPVEVKYIIGFIAGCLSMLALRLAED